MVPREAVLRRSEVTAVYVVDGPGRAAPAPGAPGHGRRRHAASRCSPDCKPGERVALEPVKAGMAAGPGELRRPWTAWASPGASRATSRIRSSRRCVALVAFLLGLFAVAVTPREEEPQINVTMANVFIPFPGASVRDVETLVATPAEQVLAQMTGVEHVYSVSRPGMSVLTVQFKVGVPRIDALVRLHDTMSSNRDWVSPKLGILEPIIKPKGIDDVPVVTLDALERRPRRRAPTSSSAWRTPSRWS